MNQHISVTKLSRQGVDENPRVMLSGEFRGTKGGATIMFFGDTEPDPNGAGRREKLFWLPTSQIDPQTPFSMRKVSKFSVPKWLARDKGLMEHAVGHE